MAVFIFTRRSQRTIQHLFFPLFPNFTTKPSPFPSSFCSSSLHLLSHSSQQTHGLHYNNLHHFSTINVPSPQNLYDPIELYKNPIHADKTLQLGLIETIKQAKQFSSENEAMAFLDETNLKLDSDLLCSAIWELRDEWRLAFLVFKWGEKRGCRNALSLIIWVLGNCNKFSIAWCLIRDMNLVSVDIRKAMLVLIDRYAAANNPSKAIKTFEIMENFKMSPDGKALYALLTSLCTYGSIEEAEEYMLQNNKLFPLQTEGFNIILNGWCNISLDIFEAKRVWKEMSKRCLLPDATSYTHMISCFSKVGNLFDSLRLYDEMKKKGFVPKHEVYNSIMYILTRENCLKEALKTLNKMRDIGLQPDSTSYNSIIRPLCEEKKLEEAKVVLATMINENLNPTIDTYHAFLKASDFEETLEMIDRMSNDGLTLDGDTFLLILDKFLKSEQPENALMTWVKMKDYIAPSSLHYIMLVEGLAKCGWLIKAREFYHEMKSKGLADDPKLKKLLKEQEHGNGDRRRKPVNYLTRDTWSRKVSRTRLKKKGYGSRKKGSNKKSDVKLD